jgi:hypothetical protein
MSQAKAYVALEVSLWAKSRHCAKPERRSLKGHERTCRLANKSYFGVRESFQRAPDLGREGNYLAHVAVVRRALGYVGNDE